MRGGFRPSPSPGRGDLKTHGSAAPPAISTLRQPVPCVSCPVPSTVDRHQAHPTLLAQPQYHGESKYSPSFLILRCHQTSLPEQTSHEWNLKSAAGALHETASTTPLPDTAPRSEATAATRLWPIPSHHQQRFRPPRALSSLLLQRNPHALPRRPESTGDRAEPALGAWQIRAPAFHSQRDGSPTPTIGSVPEATSHGSATGLRAGLQTP